MRVWMVAAALVWACGCGGGGGSGGPNRGTQCAELLQVACGRFGDCQIIAASAVGNCEQSGQTSCCGGNCATPVVSTQAEVDTCIADIDAATCASLDIYTGGTLPPSCYGVVRSAHKAVSSALSATEPTSPPVGARLGGLMSQ